MRVVFLLVTCLLGSGCVDDEATRPAEETAKIEWRDDERGFSVSYPDTWRRAASPLTPNLSDPVELFALGTYALRPGGDRCAHQPVNAVEDLGPRDALIVVFERAPPYVESGYPPRQGTPELEDGTGRFCVPGTNRFDSWFSFGESGRAFYALIALGGNASEETRAQLRAVYESLEFDER